MVSGGSSNCILIVPAPGFSSKMTSDVYQLLGVSAETIRLVIKRDRVTVGEKKMIVPQMNEMLKSQQLKTPHNSDEHPERFSALSGLTISLWWLMLVSVRKL